MLYATEGALICPICKEPVNQNLECDICGMVVERLSSIFDVVRRTENISKYIQE